MKNLLFILMIAIGFTSCEPVEIIPQNELQGIWKLNGYSSSNYKVEITPDGYLYWFNYNDDYNRIEEFEIEYNPNYNNVRLYYRNGNVMQHDFSIYRQGNGRLYFSIPITGYDANGNMITDSDTYYKMN